LEIGAFSGGGRIQWHASCESWIWQFKEAVFMVRSINRADNRATSFADSTKVLAPGMAHEKLPKRHATT